jgi:hypothetical protein
MGFTWQHGTSNTTQAHYMVTPTLLLLSALFVQLDARPHLVAPAAWNRLRVGGLLVVLVTALFSFEVGDVTDRGAPTWSGGLDAARLQCAALDFDRVEVPIAPRGFGGFYAPVPCSKLGRPP